MIGLLYTKIRQCKRQKYTFFHKKPFTRLYNCIELVILGNFYKLTPGWEVIMLPEAYNRPSKRLKVPQNAPTGVHVRISRAYGRLGNPSLGVYGYLDTTRTQHIGTQASLGYVYNYIEDNFTNIYTQVRTQLYTQLLQRYLSGHVHTTRRPRELQRGLESNTKFFYYITIIRGALESLRNIKKLSGIHKNSSRSSITGQVHRTRSCLESTESQMI